MASIGRITGSGASMSNELTIAAAAFNIDFSLLKLEAPREFNGLRNALSPQRIENAEDGQHHITARQLGALFGAKVPEIPNLISKYGTRVSEICSGLDEQTQSNFETGIFAGQTGPDGLNIWAGATSGTSGLAAHLLACLLARIWKAHEATSLWVDIVESRKQEILVASETGTDIASLMASRQIISRQQLASWDASARAWLQTADSERRRQHIQLNLIINNLKLPVNTCHAPYQSVMDTWIEAMKGMELLVQGISQRVNDGAILLAMSSWHLYSDLEVLLHQTTSVHQNDYLMQGSVVTVSAQRSDSQKNGVFWSLPLSRMRFYSQPVPTERKLAFDTNRVTMAEFCIAVLGGITEPWCQGGYQRDDIMKSILLLQNWLGASAPPWVTMLANASLLLDNAQGLEKQQYHKLLGRGARRGRQFVNDDSKPFEPCFGLTDPSILLTLLPESRNGIESPESKVRILRLIAKSSGIKPEDILIRYERLKWPSWSGREKELTYEYASALPLPRESRKRSYDGSRNVVNTHQRWVPLLTDLREAPDISCDGTECVCSKLSRSGTKSCHDCSCAIEGYPCTEFCHERDSKCSNFAPIYPLVCCGECSDVCNTCWIKQQDAETSDLPGISDLEIFRDSDSGSIKEQKCRKCEDRRRCAGWHNNNRKLNLEVKAEECYFILPDDVVNSPENSLLTIIRTPSGGLETFKFLLGIEDKVAIFSKENVEKPKPSSWGRSYKVLEAVKDDQSVHKTDFQNYLDNLSYASGTVRSLLGLAFAEKLYRVLGRATVSMESLTISLQDVRWLDWISTTRRNNSEVAYTFRAPSTDLDVFHGEARTQLAVSFACIAMFDSGEFDIDPRALLGTFALSSGDSIYLTSAITKDPAQTLERTQIRRNLGNLGRPELAFLVTTAEPMLGGLELASWCSVEHDPFDGKFHNSFTGTSLHLTLTDFELPIDVGDRGLRDTQVVILESVVSLNDKGKLMGDLNIVSCLDDPLLTIGCFCGNHIGNGTGGGTATIDTTALVEMLKTCVSSIDCWDEFFDFPIRRGIIRTAGNWQGRIAAVAAAIQKRKRTLLLPEHPCIKCLQDVTSLEPFDLIIA
ncbi:hypothetical protein FSST1_010037 [Fusarium sambucinum]